MLLRFRISNFRSFKDECTLDMEAAGKPRSGKKSNSISVQVRGTGNKTTQREVLLSAGVFGANASGKSNLLNALVAMKRLVSDSMHSPLLESLHSPFALDESSRNEATLFEAELIINGVRYIYGFEVDDESVRKEWLTAYPEGRKRLLFDRDGARKDEFRFDSTFRGDKNSLKIMTRQDTLFLTVASRLNNPDTAPVFNWFRQLLTFRSERRPVPSSSTRMAYNDEIMLEKISKLIEAADTGIAKIKVTRTEIPDEDLMLQLLDPEIDSEIKKKLEQEYAKRNRDYDYDVFFFHKGESSLVPLTYYDESAGTRMLFTLAGPIIRAIESGSLFVIDEIDASLHVLLIKELLQLFHDTGQNKNGAQIIFTSHSALLLDDQILQRDQIWLTEKDNCGVSELVPLTDFKPGKKYESVVKDYLAGKYGAIPSLTRLM
jgi:AAA15 family ATPase/GTPase